MKHLRITVEGIAYTVTVEELDSPTPTDQPAAPPQPSLAPAPQTAPVVPPAPASAQGRAPAPINTAPASQNNIISPLAGTVVKIEVAVGQEVAAGDVVMTLEAMKMNTPVSAPHAATIKAIAVDVGHTVQEGQILITLA